MPVQDRNHYQATLPALFERMDEIAAQCADRFPLFRLATATQWTLSRRGSWLGGFWAGLWWLRATHSGRSDDHATAGDWSARLQPLLFEPSINRSFVFWYGAAIGHQAFKQDLAALRLASQAALAISADFDPERGCWTLGPGMGAGENGTRTLNVDALAPTLALLHHHGGAQGRAQARQHLQTCLRHLATEQGAWRANAIMDGCDHRHQEPAGAWPRGQAWAMLGLAAAVRLYGETHGHSALQACIYWTERWGDIHRAPAAEQAQQKDLSAQVISAVAMLELFECMPDQHWLYRQAHRQIASILGDSDITETGQFIGHLYRIGPHEERRVESACATFFLLKMLLSD
ncbi:glucuronyl hydrolase [Stutzerimonas kirkiae]|uniref:Glucuronyl hydrolase n=1 Tax=Stutzerimonas kirkiae TaxID=2211392 RepID=A0A4Q9R8E9_9GAMM|nr:glucuronyl hydrolase [Stutzerimonas kirkiae]TBU96897.1 glucuronyl hydrolase [Stutzerimonas kirkiae]TBV01076.1 glucuronyl hydrolase [Stutzerimonas kirkiae]TBV08447.1 glucuronyl hydrolase [Stutzerimonas kirkiae]TBV16935.1 glucuronyl hydrolase [Stutzerimonas kirkiae]